RSADLWVMLQLRIIPLLYVVLAAGVFTVISGIVYVADGVRQLQAEGHAHPAKSQMRATLETEGHMLPKVAIVGRPNVGKSALFNRLAGRKIAIVHDQPGITRDRLSATCTRSKRPFTLWDTGGIFGTDESELTQQVQRAAENALRESDLLLFVVDGKEGLSPVDEELARMLRKSHKPVVLVINKIDTEKHDPLAAEFESLGFETLISVSAEHDRGVSELLDAIERRLPSPA